MEIVRQQLGSGDKGEFRSRQLTARRMLNNELEGAELEAYVEERLLTTTLEKAANWARGNAFMPATFGLACCAIEMMAAVNARMDIARFGFEAFRASPRQADLMIISGRVSIKMAPVVRRVYDQMLEPKWAIAMGACSSLDGRLQQLRDRAGRQVHAGRHPHPGLPAAARGARLRDPQAARDGHGQARPGLAHPLRRRRHGGVRPEGARGRPEAAATRSTSPPRPGRAGTSA